MVLRPQHIKISWGIKNNRTKKSPNERNNVRACLTPEQFCSTSKLFRVQGAVIFKASLRESTTSWEGQPLIPVMGYRESVEVTSTVCRGDFPAALSSLCVLMMNCRPSRSPKPVSSCGLRQSSYPRAMAYPVVTLLLKIAAKG